MSRRIAFGTSKAEKTVTVAEVKPKVEVDVEIDPDIKKPKRQDFENLYSDVTARLSKKVDAALAEDRIQTALDYMVGYRYTVVVEMPLEKDGIDVLRFIKTSRKDIIKYLEWNYEYYRMFFKFSVAEEMEKEENKKKHKKKKEEEEGKKEKRPDIVKLVVVISRLDRMK